MTNSSATANDRFAIVGSRTTVRRSARGTGISVFAVSDGHPWQKVAEYPTTNPSFLAVDPHRPILHAVHGDGTEISTLAIDPRTGALSLLGTQSTKGTNPAHLTFTPDGRHVVVANHSSGSVVALPVLPDGTLDPVVGFLQLDGVPGPHRTDQTGPKPHQVVFDPTGRFLFVPDKGLDTVFVCRIDDHGQIIIHSRAHAREGAGPRHVAYHPTLPVVYSIDELSSTVTVFGWDAESGELNRRQILPSTAPEDTDETRGAEIAVHPGGRFVYASNRRGAGDHTPGGPDSDTIAIYRVDPESGRLQPVGWHSTGGIRPRHFTLDRTRMYVAHERSHTIDIHQIDSDTGELTHTEEVVQTGSPVCVLFAAYE